MTVFGIKQILCVSFHGMLSLYQICYIPAAINHNLKMAEIIKLNYGNPLPVNQPRINGSVCCLCFTVCLSTFVCFLHGYLLLIESISPALMLDQCTIPLLLDKLKKSKHTNNKAKKQYKLSLLIRLCPCNISHFIC